VPVILTSEGRTLCASPPWMQVMDNTADALGSMRRATSVVGGSYNLCRAQDRVAGQVRLCRVASGAANGNVKTIRGGHHRARPDCDGARRQRRPVV